MLCAAGVACCDDGPTCCGTEDAAHTSDADHRDGSESVPTRSPVEQRDPCFCTGTALTGTRTVVPSAQSTDEAFDGALRSTLLAEPCDAASPRITRLPRPPLLAEQTPLLI